MAMVKSVKEERPEVKPAAKKKRPSGKSNWASLNKQRKDRVMALARRKQGLPVTRLRYKVCRLGVAVAAFSVPFELMTMSA